MIEVESVTKCYGPVTAVDCVSFRLQPGEIVGFLGPNGAGKSTLLKMISTWLVPTAGKIAVNGHDTQREALAVRRSLGYLPEHNALYDGMRVDRFLTFIGKAHGLDTSNLGQRLTWVVERCGLQAVLKKRIQQCSKGYRQRVGVAAALIHDPPVIVLDEPTHGLDPLQVVAFREFIMQLREGRAILFSSHILSEVLSISERVLLIHRGKLLHDGPVRALSDRARTEKTSVEDVILNMVRQSQGAVTGIEHIGGHS